MTAEQFSVVERLGGDDFLARTLGRSFKVARGEAASLAGLVSWDDLNAILTHHRFEPPRLRLAANGEQVPAHTYSQPIVTRRSTVWHRLQPSELHKRLADGATLVLDAIDELHPGISALTGQLERWLRTGVQANLYASWTGTEGFGVHWDDHDVVVVQLDGAKRWRIYGPTRALPMHRDVETPEPPPEVPVAELVLTAGDVLYLPRGWWHAVAASEGEHSLHVTCGLQSTTGADLITWLSEMLRAHEAVRADLPRFGSAEEQRAFLDAIGKLLAGELESEDLIARFSSARDATERARLAPSLPHITAAPPDADLQVRLVTTRPALVAAPDGTARLTAGGEEWTFAAKAEPVLALLADGERHRLADLAQAAGITLAQAAGVVTELVDGQAAAIGGP
ncbi:cupin domain-containing protein [Kitasatospora cineracea]|uniref:Ribosomal protein L16 Arg81 hydroxylase n=1 Tax=Kitasatospora cineracea TaxID=88074 RepID=A0A8G1UDS7_9ACTN|nr:cupin domain-containing protein [Kitasatospora cineracea]ROR38021.1 ribosomal protein L16 Arg81 hydroxylase [Kitasatospora cineracea]